MGVEGQPVPALTFNNEPAATDKGATLSVSGAERLENDSQTFVGKLGNVIIGSDGSIEKVGWHVLGGDERENFRSGGS